MAGLRRDRYWAARFEETRLRAPRQGRTRPGYRSRPSPWSRNGVRCGSSKSRAWPWASTGSAGAEAPRPVTTIGAVCVGARGDHGHQAGGGRPRASTTQGNGDVLRGAVGAPCWFYATPSEARGVGEGGGISRRSRASGSPPHAVARSSIRSTHRRRRALLAGRLCAVRASLELLDRRECREGYGSDPRRREWATTRPPA